MFRLAMAVEEYAFRVEDIPGKENFGAGLDILANGLSILCSLMHFKNGVLLIIMIFY